MHPVLLIIMLLWANRVPTMQIQDEDGYQKLTVAKVRDKNADAYCEVVFLESARFYQLKYSNTHFREYIKLLESSEKNKSVLKVKFTVPHGNIIDSIQKDTIDIRK